MTQFDFYGTWNDSWKIIDMILRRGFSLIPDQWYKTPSADLFNELNDDLKKLVHKKRRVFIWSESISLYEPQFVLQKSGPKQGEYSISSDHGGPCLDLTLPACFEKNSKINLSCGIFTFPKEFKNIETDEWLKAPASIKNAFKSVCEDLKILLKCLKLNKKVWVGEDAYNLINKGEAIIVDKD